MLLEEVMSIFVGFENVSAILQIIHLRFQLHHKLLLLLPFLELLQVLQVLFTTSDLRLIAPLLQLVLHLHVGVIAILQDLVPKLLIKSKNRQLFFLHDRDSVYLLHLLHFIAQLIFVLSLIFEEAFIRILIMECCIGLIHEIIFNILLLFLIHFLQLIEADFGVDPPGPHLIELGLNLKLLGLAPDIFELLLFLQFIVKLNLLLRANLLRVHVADFFVPQEVKILLVVLVLLEQVMVL